MELERYQNVLNLIKIIYVLYVPMSLKLGLYKFGDLRNKVIWSDNMTFVCVIFG